MFMRDDRILQNSVECLKQNGASQHLEIKIMMGVYQTVMTNTCPNYNVFWVILTLSKSGEIDCLEYDVLFK